MSYNYILPCLCDLVLCRIGTKKNFIWLEFIEIGIKVSFFFGILKEIQGQAMPPIYEVSTTFGVASTTSLVPGLQCRSSTPLSTLGVGSSSTLGPRVQKSPLFGGDTPLLSTSQLRSARGTSDIAKWAEQYLLKKEKEATKPKMEESFPIVHVEKKKSLADYFQKEPCFYSHHIFKNAGLLYKALRHVEESDEVMFARHAPNFMANTNQNPQPDVEIPQLDFDDEDERRLTFELAFNTLKYQQVLEVMLAETAFFSQFPEVFSSEELPQYKEEEGITTVMLYDFQKRKFQLRTPLDGEVLDPLLKDIEKSIVLCKTKLNASLAKNRIKANALSVDHLLPESLREKEELKTSLPIYAWVNQLKRKVTGVIEELRSEGFRFVTNSPEPFEGQCFRLDDHCTDTLVFPSDQAEFLKTHLLFERHELIIQDKSSCLAPHVVKSVLAEGTDIMQVNIGSGLIAAHLASLTKDTDTAIIAFGIRGEDHMHQVTSKLDECGAAKYVKIISENFKEVEADDVRFRGVRSILLTAECSKTGIIDPIDFILTEGEDMSILKDLSAGEYDSSKIGELIAKHNQYLKHCMKFTKVHNLVYMTRSIKDTENDKVVSKVLEFSNQVQMTRRIPAYRLQRPLLPLDAPNRFGEQLDENERLDTALKLPGYSHNHRFIKFDASSENTGCFIALMVRDVEEVKESAKDVLARAGRLGLLGNMTGKGKGKHRTKEDKTAKKEETDEQHKAVSDSVLEKANRKKSEGSRTKLSKGKVRRPRSWPKKGTGSASFTSPRMNNLSSNTKMPPAISASKLSSSLARNKNKQLAALHTKQFPQSLGEEDGLLGEAKRIPEYQKVVHHPGPFSDPEDCNLEARDSLPENSRLSVFQL
ncbi:putative methyltransferase NSUN7 isoform X2 [Lineus longissimus]|uniref:putative methyltransferase NSUN7 isoform X2 n=1 Tax=Lineus longissimus TaxID=88925 RepID=UPI00315DE2DB